MSTPSTLVLEFPPDLSNLLSDLASKERTTPNEIVRRAITLYRHLSEAGVTRGAKKLAITDPNGVPEERIAF